MADPGPAGSKAYALLECLKPLGFLQKIIQAYISTASKKSRELLPISHQGPAFLLIP